MAIKQAQSQGRSAFLRKAQEGILFKGSLAFVILTILLAACRAPGTTSGTTIRG